jgi:ketosteroid isomerase-like protein
VSRKNLELVIRASRAACEQPPDWETINALYHPEHVFATIQANKLGDAEAVGARGYKALLEGVLPFEMEFEGAVDIGPDIVLSVATVRFRGASSGVGGEQRLWAVVTVADGKITRTEAHADPAEALEAVGLSE